MIVILKFNLYQTVLNPIPTDVSSAQNTLSAYANFIKIQMYIAKYSYDKLYIWKDLHQTNSNMQKYLQIFLNIVEQSSAFCHSCFLIRFRMLKSNDCDSSSQAIIYENFVNYFYKSKDNNKCISVLNYTCKGLQKSELEL